MSKKMDIFFSMTLVALLIIRSYGVPVLGGTFSDFLLVVICAFMIINQKSLITTKDTVFCFLPFFAYLLANIGLTWHTDLPISDQILDWIRSIMFYYILIFGVKKYFNIVTAYKAYRALVVFSTLFLIIQYVSVVFWGRYISGFFGPLSLIDSNILYSTFSMYSISTYRPNSFFPEPAHYATFVIAFLTMNCLQKINFKSVILTIFIVFGVLLSGSTTGLILCALILCFWMFNFFRKTNNIKFFFIILILAIGAFKVLSQMDSFQFMLYRTFQSSDASNSRLSWMSKDVFPFHSIMDYLFGVGNCSTILQNGNGWLPGWGLLLQNYGIIGVIIYLICSITLFIKSSSKSRILLIVFWILSIGAEVTVDHHLLLFLPFVIAGVENLTDGKLEKMISE